MSKPATENLAAECREAFHRLAAEHAAIKPRGYDSERARLRKRVAIDAILDQYAEHCEIADLERGLS